MNALKQLIGEKRIGKFMISTEMWYDLQWNQSAYKTFMLNFFGKLCIVKAEYDEFNDTLTYIAYSDLFHIADDLNNPPQYNIEMTSYTTIKHNIRIHKVDE
jgi:hypothetical protein